MTVTVAAAAAAVNVSGVRYGTVNAGRWRVNVPYLMNVFMIRRRLRLSKREELTAKRRQTLINHKVALHATKSYTRKVTSIYRFLLESH